MRNPLGLRLVYHGWFCGAIVRFCVQQACKVIALQPEKEKNYQAQLFSSECPRQGKIFNGHLKMNIGLKLDQDQTVITENHRPKIHANNKISSKKQTVTATEQLVPEKFQQLQLFHLWKILVR